MTIRFNSKTLEWAWLSNFHPATVTDKLGRVWPSSEHAYQGLSCVRAEDQERIRQCRTAAAAKSLIKTLERRPDWDAVKIGIMRRIIRRKFEQHPDLAAKLLETGDDLLIHDAPWGDTFWGVCRGVGQNWQGVITMEIREELKNK